MYQCRNAMNLVNREEFSSFKPDRFAIASSLMFLPGCIYDRKGSNQLFWNKRSHKHPDKNVQEWCSKYERCKSSPRLCISTGRK